MKTSKLQEWINKQTVSDEVLWKGAWGSQMAYMRDTLVPLMGAGLFYREVPYISDVISEHRSKSIVLPVLEVTRGDLGVRFTARNNFYNWKLSVLSERPIEADFSGLFHTSPPIEPDYTGNPLSSVYFEGFPADRVYGYYDADHRRFSAEINGGSAMYTSVFLIMRSLGAIKPLKWNTSDKYPAELREETRLDKERDEREKNL